MKDKIGLFSGTAGAIEALKSATINAVNMLVSGYKKKKYQKPAAIGAYDVKTGMRVAMFSGSIPSNIHPELIRRANMIGGIGTYGVSVNNIVGKCAEFQVVNHLLKNGSNISDIRFTSPVRPRTGELLDFCANCKAMFSDIISKGV